MARYIDADKLIEELRELQQIHSPSMSKIANEAIDLGLSLAMKTAGKAPTADVVEVVRCKNCKWFKPIAKGVKCACVRQSAYREPTDFCSMGERRTDNDL